MRYEHSIPKLENMLPWLPLLVAANLMGRETKGVSRWISTGKIRARRLESPYTTTGERIEVYREDCVYLLTCLRDKTGSLTLWERGVAPLECEGMTGEEIYAHLKETGMDTSEPSASPASIALDILKRIPPDVAVIPPVTVEDFSISPELLHKRVSSLETAMQTLLSAYGGVAKRDALSDGDIEGLLQQALHVYQEEITLKDCSAWVRSTRQLSQDHFSLINQWGRTHPRDASCYIDASYPAYFLLIQATFRARALLERWPGSDKHGTGLYGLRLQVISEHERLQKLTFGQMQLDAFMRLQHPGGIPVGHTVTDNYIIDFVIKRRIRVGGRA